MWCPHCRQDAPLVYRGASAYCSACNEPRPPLSATSLNLAGRPSKLGGTASRVLGYGVLTAGLGTSVVLMLLFALLAPTSAMGYAVGIPLAIVSLIVGLALVYAGRRLHRSGADAEREARERALYALAANRGGLLTALDGARSLNLSVASVEAALTDWAKREPEHVSLEIDDEGAMFYVFSRPGDRRDTFGKRYRVEPEGRVRVLDAVEAEEQDGELDGSRSRGRR
ncbi:MAG TPA: hypothetical protein VFZ53_07540 [Polyangiaceae bacterium]